MNTVQGQGWSRRRFVVTGLAAGAAMALAPSLVWGQKDGAAGRPVFRNPAYSIRREGNRTMLVCRDTAGHETAYQADDLAAQFWELVPSAEDYQFKGRRETVESVTEALAKRLGTVDESWKRDAQTFAEEALRERILLTENETVYIAYAPALEPIAKKP